MNAHVTFQIKNLKTNDLTNRFLTYLQSKKCPCSINRSCFVKKPKWTFIKAGVQS